MFRLRPRDSPLVHEARNGVPDGVLVRIRSCSRVRLPLRGLTFCFEIHALTSIRSNSAFGGLIAFGIQNANIDIAPWRLLFIVEGCPTVLLGLLTMWILPNRPEETSFLTEAERKLQFNRMNRGLRADVGRTVNKAHISAAFKDWRVSRQSSVAPILSKFKLY